MSQSKPLLGVVALVLGVVVLATSAHAELLAYDQFTGYTDGNLAGQGEGFGWGANNWVDLGGNGVTVSGTAGLTHPALCGVTTGGGGSTLAGAGEFVGVKRTLGTLLLGPETYYFGWVVQETGSPYHAQFAVDDGAGGQVAFSGTWNAAGTWRLVRKDGNNWGDVNTGVARTPNTTLMVIKLELGAADTATLFVDPADATALSGAGNASYTFNNNFGSVGILAFWTQNTGGNVGNITVDEIRVGTEAADMFSPTLDGPSFADLEDDFYEAFCAATAGGTDDLWAEATDLAESIAGEDCAEGLLDMVRAAGGE